jgi:hypothetical protein
MNTFNINLESTPVPDNLTLAKRLAALVHAFTGPNTENRERLREMGNYLNAIHPDTKAALRAAIEGLQAANLAENRHEDVLLCAIVKLLDGAQVAEPRVTVPELGEMDEWLGMLMRLGDDLMAEPEPTPLPARGSAEAATMALQIQTLRLWLTGLYSVRVHTFAGVPLKRNAEGLPALA